MSERRRHRGCGRSRCRYGATARVGHVRPRSHRIAATCPSGADPLNGHIPRACTTIQSLADDQPFHACHSGSSMFPNGTPFGPNGNHTPSAEAVGHLCDRVRAGRIGVGIFAFDGVPDADYNDATPAAAFGERIGRCAADGLVIHVAAAPANYRYVYIFADRRYGQYAQHVAVGLRTFGRSRTAARWRSRRSRPRRTASTSPVRRSSAFPERRRDGTTTSRRSRQCSSRAARSGIGWICCAGRPTKTRTAPRSRSNGAPTIGNGSAAPARSRRRRRLFVNQDVVTPALPKQTMPFVAAANTASGGSTTAPLSVIRR